MVRAKFSDGGVIEYVFANMAVPGADGRIFIINRDPSTGEAEDVAEIQESELAEPLTITEAQEEQGVA